ncbi:MAG: hypothetical protein DI596_00405 [Azospira oryzae]|uniref:Uncharacterized protein n=1 Tax=Pelomicrobium methylotrophicum TaxID=2602750 RepID=A0A5C7ET62_9PROT|nr:hypothetical protein [Pelomicrobium methylotrophicum]PZP65028.1 MAG: hypothetical protein DI596_00405 [Azospira oryzae]PZP82993.1 MAG: hypothetical protein DI593_00405 [Azospira oryzae]TXF10516.1 hypothetical protein FR698_14955 [Pelomicrobium methylotrophicum]
MPDLHRLARLFVRAWAVRRRMVAACLAAIAASAASAFLLLWSAIETVPGLIGRAAALVGEIKAPEAMSQTARGVLSSAEPVADAAARLADSFRQAAQCEQDPSCEHKSFDAGTVERRKK